MPRISIIVPVYKAENVLAKCVDSVLAQTFADWELLLIDDGSPDGSGALCDDYAGQDDRVRVFHKPNGGVSSARNLGMEEAGADSAGCAHWNIQPGGEKWAESGALPAGVYDAGAIRKGIVDRLLGQRLGKPGEVLNGFIWRFLFSRAIIIDHDIRFSGAYLEDELFLMEYFCLARKLAMVDEPLYYYLQNPASVTRNYLPDYMDTFRRFLAAKEAVVERYGLEGDDPQWRQSTCWAGLLIAIGNEYATGKPSTLRVKLRRVECLSCQPGIEEVIRVLEPRGMGRNKQLVAGLVRRRWFGLLSLMYAVKNRR